MLLGSSKRLVGIFLKNNDGVMAAHNYVLVGNFMNMHDLNHTVFQNTCPTSGDSVQLINPRCACARGLQ